MWLRNKGIKLSVKKIYFLYCYFKHSLLYLWEFDSWNEFYIPVNSNLLPSCVSLLLLRSYVKYVLLESESVLFDCTQCFIYLTNKYKIILILILNNSPGINFVVLFSIFKNIFPIVLTFHTWNILFSIFSLLTIRT